MFPDAQFAQRGAKHELRQVIKIATEKEFTDLIIVNEDHKEPSKSIKLWMIQYCIFTGLYKML
jgi:rRNA maturation protein Rpf1